MLNYREGNRARLPFAVLRHMVAARYGQDPRAVDEWPAELFLEAVRVWEVTG